MEWIDELTGLAESAPETCQPFSFVYDGAASNTFLNAWPQTLHTEELEAGVRRILRQFRDPHGQLELVLEMKRFADFPAAEWVIRLANTGRADTPIISDLRALDTTFDCHRDGPAAYVLHRTIGAPSDPTDFEPTMQELCAGDTARFAAGLGRSSYQNLPFFRIDTDRGAALVAIGWTGQWAAELSCDAQGQLRVRAGMGTTHFCLHPGECVRTPRILLLLWEGDADEAHNQFRRLIYRHYVPTYRGGKPEPFVYCNTAFTRGGLWLNECNEQNQISLIRALAPLHVEAVVTDAGWFEGGWPSGAGNWTVDPAKYPRGMAPVAAAAQEAGAVYGLWYEPERVTPGSRIDREHPQWVLYRTSTGGEYADRCRGLINLALPEARQWLLDMIEPYMALPGFEVYRQDFNMHPLDIWRDHDAPDRQGITEMHYIEALYAYWDELIARWPNSFRIGCASGGRRIDLESITRFHTSQKSDYWFDNEVDQASMQSLARWLPNVSFIAPVNRLDDYSFHSAMLGSLNLGWIADDSDFDIERAGQLVDRYRAVRRLLIGDFYALTDYDRSTSAWCAMQFHRPDLNEGMLILFRRSDASATTFMANLQQLDTDGQYELKWLVSGEVQRDTGATISSGLNVTVPEAPGSELITYRRF